MSNEKKQSGIITWICTAVLTVIVLPLLILGICDFPSMDDWSLGVLTYRAVQEGRGLFGVLKEAVRTAYCWRSLGEARYANAFLGALQPGIWGEQFYCITPWLMIGSLIFSELLLGRYLVRRLGGDSRWLCAFLVPSLAIQILCVPYPVETFYWYVGAVNYTFIFSLCLILLYIFLKLTETGLKRIQTVILEVLGILSAVLVGGDSYSASLSFSCLFFCLSVWLLVRYRKGFWRTLPITVLTIAGLIVSASSQGNLVRLESEFGGSVSYSVPEAVGMSFVRTFTNVVSWSMDLKVPVLIILMLPFMGLALRNTHFGFRRPLLFSLFTFGVYAAQITVNMYVEGGIAARRIADILYYGYHVWLVLNLGYWAGWLLRRKLPESCRKAAGWMQRHALKYFVLAAGVLALIFVIAPGGLKQSSTYRACVWLIRGDARAYREAWQERLKVLKDPEVKEVYFDPLPGQEELVFYADLKQGEAWVNDVCADYYEKEKVGLKP